MGEEELQNRIIELDKERKLNNRLKLNVRSWERKREGSLHVFQKYVQYLGK